MTAGPVNRALLESFFQSPGEIYDDAKTEGALDVLADQIDDNSVIFNADGSLYVPSSSIAGVTGVNVYAQLVSLKQQIDAIVGSNIPPGAISTDMIVDLAVTEPKIADGAVSWDKQSFVRANGGVFEYSIDGSVWLPVAGVKAVQRGSSTLTRGSNGIQTNNVTISSVNTSKSFVEISYYGSDDKAYPTVKATLTSATNLELSASFVASSTSNVVISWQVIEYN
jgi:hypothetical protein